MPSSAPSSGVTLNQYNSRPYGSFVGTITPSYCRTDTRVQIKPRGDSGKLTLTRLSSVAPSNVEITRCIQGLSGAKSVVLAGALNAIPRKPSSAACFAPASVPECHVELPRLNPRLQPDNTRSTLPHLWAPSATQSAGVPLTRNAVVPAIGVARYDNGRVAVMA